MKNMNPFLHWLIEQESFEANEMSIFFKNEDINKIIKYFIDIKILLKTKI